MIVAILKKTFLRNVVYAFAFSLLSLNLLRADVCSIYENRKSAIVLVRSTLEDGSVRVGSGFFISDNGHILTAYNTVVDGKSFHVDQDLRRYDAVLIGVDAFSGTALLKLNSLPDNASHITITEAQKLPAIGSSIVSLSCKLALNVSPQTGIVTNLNGYYCDKEWPITLIRSSIAIDGADCGGAVFDLTGNFVGMLLHSIAESSETYTMPANGLHKVCNDLLLFGRVRYGYIGIVVEVVFDKLRETLCLQIVSINSRSPAEKAGLQPLDILLSINGTEIKTRDDLRNFTFLSYPEQKLSLAIMRKDQPKSIEVIVAERDSHEKAIGSKN